MLMESPFYFETPLRERLEILKHAEERFNSTSVVVKLYLRAKETSLGQQSGPLSPRS